MPQIMPSSHLLTYYIINTYGNLFKVLAFVNLPEKLQSQSF